MLRTCNLLLTTIVALGLSTSLATTALAHGKGKPGGGGGGSTLPPVRYQVQFWTIQGANYIREIGDTNSAGQTVGQFEYDRDGDGRTDTARAFLYDPNVDPESGFDLNLIVAGIPAGWEIHNASAINELGQIAGHIGPDDTSSLGSPEFIQAVMIDLNELPPRLYAIPDSDLTSYSRATYVNDWGDIAVRYRRADGSFGHYIYNFDPAWGIEEPWDLGISTVKAALPRINNARTVAGDIGNGDAYRMTWDGSVEIVKGVSPRAMNEAGAFCGHAIVTSKGNKTSNQAFVYDAALELFPDLQSRDLNESKDFAGSSKLYHRNYGALTVKELLDPSDPDSTIAAGQLLFVYTITNRDPVTTFPALGATSGNKGATLVPVPAP